MKNSKNFLAGLLILGFGQLGLAHTSNPKLEYAMKVMAKDIAQMIQPTKAESPVDVTDGEILTAIMRARSAAFYMNLVTSNKGKVEGGKVIVGEFTVGGWDDAVKPEDVEKVRKLIPIFDDFSAKVIATLKKAEGQLEEELKKKAEARSFVALSKTSSEVDSLMAESHKIFRPTPLERAATVSEIVRDMEE